MSPALGGHDPTPSPPPLVPSYSLNDLAARLVAFEATDEDHHAILDILHALAADVSLPDGVHALMGDALCRWSNVAADERERAALEVQHLVVAALNRLELRDRFVAALGSEPSTPAERLPATGAAFLDAAASNVPPDADRSLFVDFITESRELLDQAEAALLGLEADPDDAEAVNTIFRAFHTIKGTSAFLALGHITEFAHHAETVLSRVRDREVRCTGGYADLALRSCDMLRALLEATHAVLDGGSAALPTGYDALLGLIRDPERAGMSELGGDVPRGRNGPAPTSAEGLPRPEQDEAGGSPSQRRLTERVTSEGSVRVRTERLDRLIDLVGELVIAESTISQDAVVKRGGHHELNRKVAHARKIVRELQDLSMAMRMAPLKAPFQKVARLVRDLATRSGKRVEFVAEGEDTELDRHLVDSLGDPLLHMVRNAVDHGIESAEERRAAGKPAHGTVRLSAYHSSGNVVVELSDDGRGLNREKIVYKAVQQGLIAAGEGLTDREVFELIFSPGFSTADAVTDVSGRGVGMDVVRRTIEALRGRVEIRCDAQQGTTFLVCLPLTLAIIDGMLVRVGSERYIVPTINIHLSFRPALSALFTVAGRGEMVMLRDEVMPLVRLHRVFGILDAKDNPTDALVMVVGDGKQRTALLVDELLGQQQVVAKTLGAGIGRASAISGGAILGDGGVGLILDVHELLSLAWAGDGGAASLCTARAVA